MRIWLKDEDRRPDPEPARADGRKAVVAGTALWLVALAAVLIWREPIGAVGDDWWLWAAVIGLAIGVIGFAVVQLRRRS